MSEERAPWYLEPDDYPVRLTLDAARRSAVRAIYFTSELDYAMGLDQYRLVGELDRPGFTVERRVRRRRWWAPWRGVSEWRALLVLDVDRYTVLRLPSLEVASAWLRREVAQLRAITPGSF